MARIPIQVHVANALQWLGTLYRNPADALKEHVSNAIDEHVKAKLIGAAHDRCHVTFTLDKRHIVVEYPYGMSRAEFESALRRVADSAKRAGTARAIGRLGIGIFSFQQTGLRSSICWTDGCRRFGRSSTSFSRCIARRRSLRLLI